MFQCLLGLSVSRNRFGDSGAPWELIKEFEVSAEHVAQKAVELLEIRKGRQADKDEISQLAGSRSL